MNELLLTYFNAFANLYGTVSMKRAYRIIEKQNPEMELTKEAFAEAVAALDLSEAAYAILSESELHDETADEPDVFKKHLIAEYLLFGDAEEYEDLASAQEGRSFYAPEKEELFRYTDDFYFEKTRQSAALEAFLTDELGLTNADEILEDLELMLRIDEREETAAFAEIKRIAQPKFKRFSSPEQQKKFRRLYTDLRNHTRKHTYCGHTPFEMDDCRLPDGDVAPNRAFARADGQNG